MSLFNSSVLIALYGSMPKTEDKAYYPFTGRVLPNGDLRIPIAGTTTDGERWDGYETVTQGHPRYAEWRALIEKRGPLVEAIRHQRQQRREQRRNKQES